jgi:hypothetical protein
VNAHTFVKQAEKSKQTSARTLVATIFWDRKEVLIVEFVQQGIIIISERHKKLPRAIKNVCPRTDPGFRALLEHFNWELFDHSPYSPDLAPSDYHLFTYLKN